MLEHEQQLRETGRSRRRLQMSDIRLHRHDMQRNIGRTVALTAKHSAYAFELSRIPSLSARSVRLDDIDAMRIDAGTL